MSTTTDQRSQALERANEIRLARARLRRAISRGNVFAASVLLDQPWEAQSWEVGEMLQAQKRWGPGRSRRLLTALMISETKPVGALTERQRKVLAGVLEPPGRV